MPTPKDLIAQLIPFLDDDPDREGLKDTPLRYEKFVREFFTEKPFKFTTFQSEGYDEMIIQTKISYYSLCEHHLVPFFGQATIAYIPNEKIVGLSKLSRVLTHFSQRLQNQERLTNQVADYLFEQLKPRGVGVILTGRHLCMEMRGIEKPGTETITSSLRGCFVTHPSTREEFLQFYQKNSNK